ncbi:MAG: sigma-70 family RNA polymerase sigma factor [Planctomycetota bacterium]|nr:sigma-70 family RNA polymerase sigma factor [Planctomycetota bacterium]
MEVDLVTSDADLLRAYARDGSQSAFAELVARHVDWVYSAARRQVTDPADADDVTQSVFILLATKARTFGDNPLLTIWLFRATRLIAADARKRRARRRKHELNASQQRTAMDTTTEPPLWEHVAPILDEAIARLGTTDRRAILLRFMQRKRYADVARELRVTQGAAKMRVARALEKLRALLGSRGVTTNGAALSAFLTARAVDAAPAALAVASAQSVAAAVSSATTESLVKGAVFAMALSKTKVVAAAVALAALLVTGTAVTLHHHFRAAPAVAAGWAPPAPKNVVLKDSSEWRAAINEAYALTPNQIVRLVKPPFIAERRDFVLAKLGGGPERTGMNVKEGPKSMVVEWDEQSRAVPELRVFNNVHPPLTSVIGSLLDVKQYELIGARQLLETPVEGDWVMRAGSTRAQRLIDLERVLREEAGLAVRITQRRMPQQVIVVRGTITSPETVVQLYSDRMHDDTPAKGVRNTLDDVFRQLAMFTDHRVINETSVPAGQKIGFAPHTSAWVRNMPPKRAAAKLDLILANVARQSGLQLKREMRAVDVWEVTADEAATTTK